MGTVACGDLALALQTASPQSGCPPQETGRLIDPVGTVACGDLALALQTAGDGSPD